MPGPIIQRLRLVTRLCGSCCGRRASAAPTVFASGPGASPRSSASRDQQATGLRVVSADPPGVSGGSSGAARAWLPGRRPRGRAGSRTRTPRGNPPVSVHSVRARGNSGCSHCIGSGSAWAWSFLLYAHWSTLTCFIQRAVERCSALAGASPAWGNCRYAPVATEAARRATNLLKPSGHRSTMGGSASRRAATRVKPEQASKGMS